MDLTSLGPIASLLTPMAKKKAPPHAGHRYRCSLPGLAGFTGRRWQDHKAERKGFEPPVPFGTHDFQSCTFDHSVTSPGGVRLPSSIDLHPGRGPLLFLNLSSKNLAESKGFEPLVPLPVHLISNQAPSTARSALRGGS